MFKHLLVTLDGSPRAEAVIPHAIDIAKTMGAEVTLLRVVDAANSDWSERGAIGKSQSSTSIKSTYVDQAAAYLERVAEQLRGAGVATHSVVKQGQPAKQIVATAKEADADAITMATHSRRGLNKLMFGSVAEEVLHESQLPILLVRAA
jgi:nucleotide-binding universal stress UspA family protein